MSSPRRAPERIFGGASRGHGGSDRALVIAGAAIVLIVLLATLILPYLEQDRERTELQN